MSSATIQLTDEQLAAQYKLTGHKHLVGELFKRHSIMCFAVCMKYLKNEEEAHDAVMNIFEKLFTALQKHDVNNVKSWLHTVCRNHCLIIHRKPMHELLMEVWEDEENLCRVMEMETELHPLETVQTKEQHLLALEQALHTLNLQQRLCVELYYLKHLSYEEIASTTGFTLNEVKSFLQNGKRNLKNKLSAQGISLALTLLLWIQ